MFAFAGPRVGGNRRTRRKPTYLIWLGDHMTISHADAGYWTQVAAVRGGCVTTAPVIIIIIPIQRYVYYQYTQEY